MSRENAATPTEAREKAVWTVPVLKKGAVGSETALSVHPFPVSTMFGS